MSLYTYQCSICRRIKKIEESSSHASFNRCTITKGCRGFLSLVSDNTKQPIIKSDLVDWFARGFEKTSSLNEAESLVYPSLANSINGLVTLSIRMDTNTAVTTKKIILNCEKRISTNIPNTSYIFNISSNTNILSGKDSSDKILRFDDTAISENRIIVQVDGVNVLPILTPNTATFPSPLISGNVVIITIFDKTPTEDVQIEFIPNILEDAQNSWSNVRWVFKPTLTEPVFNDSYQKHWLFTAPYYYSFGAQAFIKLKNIERIDIYDVSTILSDISECRILLSRPPYNYSDRINNYCINCTSITNDFYLQTDISSLPTIHAHPSVLTEVYPPFELIDGDNNSYIIKNSEVSPPPSFVANVDNINNFKNKIIIGPV